jgi:hypothetical protein
MVEGGVRDGNRATLEYAGCFIMGLRKCCRPPDFANDPLAVASITSAD